MAEHIRGWAPAILAASGDEERWNLSWAVESLQCWAQGMRGEGRFESRSSHKWVYTSALLVDIIRLCRYTRGAELQQVLQRAVDVTFPGILQDTMREMFSPAARRRFILPGHCTRHKYILFLDVGLMLLHRRQHCSAKKLRFGWADASPQHGRDWLVASYDCIDEKDVLPASRAVDALIAERIARGMRRESMGQQVDDDADNVLGEAEEFGMELREELVEMQSSLTLAIRRHDHPPVALGKGCHALSDKASALMYCWCLELSSLEDVCDFQNSFRAFTTDMGAEMGVAEFRHIDQSSLLPSWMNKLSLDADVDCDGGVECAAPPSLAPDLPQLCGRKLLPRSLTVPGLLHVYSNLSKELSEALPGWSVFWDNLKLLETCSATELGERHFHFS